MVQGGNTVAHCLASFGPHFGLDATATDGAGRLAVGKEKHFRAPALGGRSARVSDRGYDYSLTAEVGLTDQPIEFMLSDGSHNRYARLRRASPLRARQRRAYRH